MSEIDFGVSRRSASVEAGYPSTRRFGAARRLVRALTPLAVKVAIRYRRIFGTPLPLIRPKTLNEKINWMKIFGEIELQTICADKVTVRDYVFRKLNSKDVFNEIYLIAEKPYDIKRENIPFDKFVLKSNNDSGSAVICLNSKDFDFSAAQRKLLHRMKFDYSEFFFEPQYRKIRPKIIVEEYLENDDGSPLGDYRFLCMNGRVEFLYVNFYIEGKKHRIFFDRLWRRQHITQSYPAYPYEVDKPSFFNELVEMSEKLAEPFDFVRVDWNISNGRIYFGELTFTPQAGLGIYEPAGSDLLLGEKLRLTRSRYLPVRWMLRRGWVG